jgi:hypothetical protein
MKPADWKAYCYGMAEAMHRMAEGSHDREIVQLALELAANWITAAAHPPRDAEDLNRER